MIHLGDLLVVLMVLRLVLLLAGCPRAVLLLRLVATGPEQLRWRWWGGYLNHDVGGLADHLRLEALLGISRVLHGADETIGVHHGVAAFDDGSVADLLAVLVVGELIILHIESKLVRGVLLQKYKNRFCREILWK